ncbi:MAG TPA: hypothetical protein PLG84_06285 [Anaerolineaceae bacterium]|nr:hypothetical protein [Anaerolineaceae bacterium]HQH58440.1 hypothetical protein [Anaerolineaceae bacterium]HQL27969.1 hypothetical protein [Anaerolineaceae bacterium]
MKGNLLLAKILTILGSVLVLVPVLLPFYFGFESLFTARGFSLDYMLPVFLSLVALVGGLLLVWACVLAKTGRKFVIWSFAAVVFFLAFSQLMSVWLGLASGRVAEGGWQMNVVAALLVFYWAALALLGAAGIRLWFLLRNKGSHQAA